MKIVNTVTSDKLHLAGFLSEPNASKETAIVHFHGMAGDPYTNAWYPRFHQYYPQNKIAFLVGNHRGTGSVTMFHREPDEYPNYGNALEIFEESIQDIDAWAAYAQELGYKNIFLQAHSFAPSKVVYYMNQQPNDLVKGLIFISPVDMLGLTLASEKRHREMLQEAKEFMDKDRPNQMLSWLVDGEYYMSAKTYLNLFGENTNANVFCYTKRDHNWSMVNNLSVPVLALGGTEDYPIKAIANPQKALAILKEQLPESSLVEIKVYEGAEHSFEGFEENIAEDASNFISEVL